MYYRHSGHGMLHNALLLLTMMNPYGKLSECECCAVRSESIRADDCVLWHGTPGPATPKERAERRDFRALGVESWPLVM